MMPDDCRAHRGSTGPAVYQITIEGRLAPQWQAWFDGMTIVADSQGNTRLTGWVVDQAALFGLLRKVRDLGKPLLCVSQLDTNTMTGVER